MTKEKQNIAIYKLLGYQPRRMWRVWYNKEKSYGSCYMHSKEEAFKRVEEEKKSWYYSEFKDEYEFSEPEEYEDWNDFPEVDLDLLHKIELEIIPQTHRIKYSLTLEFISGGRKNDPNNFGFDPFICHTAKVEHRRESILKTLDLWEE